MLIRVRVALACVLMFVLLPIGPTGRSLAIETGAAGDALVPHAANRPLAAAHPHPPGTAAHTHDPGAAAAAFAPLTQDGARPVGGARSTRGRCEQAGLRRIANSDRCTHGPDPAPPGLNVSKRVPPLQETETAASAASTARAQCVDDGTSGPRVQVLYVRAADVPSRYAEYLPSFRTWADDVNRIFQESAAETGGQRAVRFVHNASCVGSIPEVVLSPAGDDDFSNTISELRALGFNRTDRVHLLFVDATVFCGLADIWQDDSPGPDNLNNFGPTFGRTDAGCWGSDVPAHELMHNLGGVQNSAPNASGGLHCTDEWDQMCYPDSPTAPPMRYVCGGRNDVARNRLFDCNHDDYFHTNPPAGSYLTTHWNTANSVFLDGATPPPPCPDALREPDDTSGQAAGLGIGGVQRHAFCTADDVDWVSFYATAGTRYRLETSNLAPVVNTTLFLYERDRSTVIAVSYDSGGTYASRVTFTAKTTGRLYARVVDDGGTTGSTGFTFDLRLTSLGVDTSPPTTPTLRVVEAPDTPNQHVVGRTVYYRPTGGAERGSFEVSATSNDPQGGIDHVAFPVVFGGDGANDPTSPYARVY